jgi:hypothetical protein
MCTFLVYLYSDISVIYCDESRDGRTRIKMTDLITNNSRLVSNFVKIFLNYANRKIYATLVHIVVYSKDSEINM